MGKWILICICKNIIIAFRAMNSKEQSRMDNTDRETQAKLRTRHRTRTNISSLQINGKMDIY